MSQVIYESPSYKLEASITKSRAGSTLDLWVTYPQAQRPTRVRKAQFTLPPEKLKALGSYLIGMA